MSEPPLTYAGAGVDIAAADRLVERIASIARSGHGPEVIPGTGAFAGLYRLSSGPVLAATADGVGTKLLVAREAGRYHGIGRDLVAMNVNDLAVVAARPLFFLDYVAAGTLDAGPITDIVTGVVEACTAVGCVLLGGETAEMPGLYRPGDLDVAGFAVGLVDESRRPDGRGARVGDVVVGLAASGIHANGMTLARAALDQAGVPLDRRDPSLGRTVAEELLEPTALYPAIVAGAPTAARAMAHVTGGGISGRAAAMAGADARIHIELGRIPVPAIFPLLQRAGNIDDAEMASTFNMGIGFLAALPPADAGSWLASDPRWVQVGRAVEGEPGAEIHP